MSTQKPRPMHFKIDWRDTSDGVACKTLASISLLIDETPVWPLTGEDTDEFEWFADELFAHLTECWKPLILRQTYSIPVQPSRPSFLMAEAAKRWASLPNAVVESEQEELAAFEDVHNLANAFGGISGLLPLWFLRNCDQMIVDTQERLSHVPLHAAIDALTSAGDEIAERLHQTDKKKWSKLLEAWRQRDKGDGTVLLALTIGRDKKTAATLISDKVLEPPSSFEEAAKDNDELRIAARMAGPLPINQIKTVIEKVRSCRPTKAPKLDSAMAAASQFLKSQRLENTRPHVQGTETAKWLRGHLNVSASGRIDPIQILERRCGVDVRLIEFGIPSLDAIAVWGSKHGPAVLLNKGSTKLPRSLANIWHNGVLRVTGAHELCHLLLDAKHTLSAVDILGGRMSLPIEQRARAFAAEFLLPSDVARAVWERAGSPLEPNGVRKVINQLCRTHGVTASVAAWQIEHGVGPFHQESLAQILDQIVPQR